MSDETSVTKGSSTSTTRELHLPVSSSQDDKTYIPIIISQNKTLSHSGSGVGAANHGEESETLLSPTSITSAGKTTVPVDHQLTISSLRSFGLLDNNEEEEYRIPSWNAFALSDPNAQLTVKSITSIGLGSTDGRNLYVRRVPSSASILISNNYAVRREANGNDNSDTESEMSFSSKLGGPRLQRKHWSNKAEFILACIGFTVGLGNIWRFPYLCYKSGGGAFLIPYFVMFIVCGLPILYMELALGQFTRRGPVGALKKICPLFKGSGIASLIISFAMSTYSVVIMAWTLYYLVASFNTDLPWRSCGNDWNSPHCWDQSNASAALAEPRSNKFSQINRTSPMQEFYDRKVLQRSSGMEELGSFRGELVLCLLFAWILVYFSLWKSVRSSGKVVYFTATFPYLLLIGFLVFALTLPGADNGLRYFFHPQWDLLWDAKVWVNAAAQNFNSIGVTMGCIITFSSYNRFSNNVFTDTVAIGVTSFVSSILVGITVFAMLGNIAHEQNSSIDDVVVDGPGLVFVVFTQTVMKMPVPHMWSVLFFFMLLCVSLNNEFALVEVVVTSVRDGFPNFTAKYFKCHEMLVLIICLASFAIGLPNVLQGGIFIFQLVDQYAACYSLMYVAFFEVAAVIWIYGVERLSRNIHEMTGETPSAFFCCCWRYLTPALILAVWILSFVNYEKPVYDNGKIEYPAWAEAVGWFVSFTTFMCIPVFAIAEIRKSSGSTFLEKLKSSTQSTIVECPLCKYTRTCNHDVDGDSEWNLHRNSIKTTKLTPVIMSEAVYEKVSSL